ncbi:MAG TPA: MOSC domain-containing protein [Candidatus Tyrphobacter sp.]
MLLGTLACIRRFPVKSLRGEMLDFVEVGATGIPGDRAQRLVVESGRSRVGEAYRGKEDERIHLTDRVEEALSLARARGIELRAESGEHFFDAAPISLLVDRWIDEVSAHVGYAVEPERFRPNFLVSAAEGFALSEGDMHDAQIEVGEVRLRVRVANKRCVAITYHPHIDAPDPEILAYIARERAAVLGVYCDVLRAGIARKGDSVRLLDR